MIDLFEGTAPVELAYREILRAPSTSADELAAAVGVPVDDIVVVLRDLDELGLVIEAPLAPLGLAVRPPEQAAELLIRRERTHLEGRLAALEATREKVPELVAEYVDSRRRYVADQVEHLTDPALVRSRLYQLGAEVAESVCALHPGPALTAAECEAALPLDLALSARGVRSRMVVEHASLGPAHWTTYLQSLLAAGHLVRVVEHVPQRSITFDDRVAVLAADPGDRPGAYVLHESSLAAPLVALFEEVWGRGRPFSTVDGSGDPELAARVRQVAVLLGRGVKDDALARRLGVSVRTVRRLIAATMTELGSTSRFEAGAEAVRRGWLD